MNKGNKNKLVPKLRFPEFEKEGEWKEKSFDKLFQIGNGKDYKHLKAGDIPVYGSGGYMLSVDSYLYEGESVCIGRKGTIDKPIFLTGKFWTVDTLFFTHSFKDCIPKFIYILFQKTNWLKHNEAGGIPSLSKTTIEKIKAFIPKVDEQKKIANCISSLDDLIAAENHKLDSFREHKKGLMQQLLPGEGKNVPQLRFKEFKNSRGWEKMPMKSKVDLLSGFPFNGSEILENNKGIPLMRGINITEGYIRHSKDIDRFYTGSMEKLEKYKLRENDLVIGMDGSKVGKNSAIVTESDSDSLLVQRVARLRAKNETSIHFIFQHINASRFHLYVNKVNTSGGIPHISAKQINDFEIYFPAYSEQKKIASCLSSLDDLMRAQNQKIEALKLHKKGLMQQLFPNFKEIETV